VQARPRLSVEDRLLMRAQEYAGRNAPHSNFVKKAMDLFDRVAMEYPRSRQAQIALIEKARFEVRYGMYTTALADYRRVRSLWPSLQVGLDAALEEAALRDDLIGDPEGAMKIRQAIFNRCVAALPIQTTTQPAATQPANDKTVLEDNQEMLLTLGLQLHEYYSRRRQWGQATLVLEQLLSGLPSTPLWDELTFRLAEVYRERVRDRARACELYRVLVASPNSPWANFALERLAQMGVNP